MTQPPPPANQPPADGPRLPPPGAPTPPVSSPPPPPGYQPPPPGYQPPPPGFQQPPPGSYPPGGAQPTPKKGRGCLIAALVVGAIIAIGIGAIIVLAVVATDSFDDAIKEAQSESAGRDDETGETGQGETPAGGDEADDLGPCVVLDADTIELDITNNSSKRSNYVIDVNFLDADGQRVGDEPFFVNYIRPGERAVEASYAFGLEGAAACEIAEVERYAAVAPDNTDEVTCTITGVDFADDVTTDLVATNGSSELSDYFIDFAVVRDGIRVGIGFAVIENIRPGESAPGEGFSVAPGPADDAICEVVNVSRTAS